MSDETDYEARARELYRRLGFNPEMKARAHSDLVILTEALRSAARDAEARGIAMAAVYVEALAANLRATPSNGTKRLLYTATADNFIDAANGIRKLPLSDEAAGGDGKEGK